MTIFKSSHPAVADKRSHISGDPIDVAGLFAKAHHPGAGAVVLFSGNIRDNSNGKNVDYLEYEVQEVMADHMIGEILEEARSRWGLNVALAVHRSGKVGVSETAVVVITASAHRSEAYAASKYIIDRIKHEAPIWKCEYFLDGTKKWGGNCNCQEITGDVHKHIYENR